MRWVTYRHGPDGADRVGVVRDGQIRALAAGTSLLGLLEEGGGDLSAAAGEALSRPDEVVDPAGVELRAPLPRPPSIRDFLAFEEHARNARRARGADIDPDWYELPVFYFTNPAAVRGPSDPVPVAPGSGMWDYELEVAAVVGRPGGDLAPAEADAAIAGYMVMCDFSARDLQAREMRLGLGPAKGKDTATSLGPALVTADELAGRRSGRGFDLAMRASVNGRRYSSGSLNTLYWSFGEMAAYASRGTTLQPGDVIGSGTVGTGCILELSGLHGPDRYPWLRPGDEVTLEVELLGTLRHRIVAGPAPVPLRPAG